MATYLLIEDIVVSELDSPTLKLDDTLSGAPRIGDYFHGLYVHSFLGEGAMGKTFLASHPVLKIPLVIKTFKSNQNNDIFKEAHLAARVNSANVVTVLDAGIENGIPFVVQQYIDGIDLANLVEIVQKHGLRLPASVIARIAIDAAQGLHAIHQAGVIHRDVKPANLFLSGDGVTTVGDFGIALDAVCESSSDTISGTPRFMAPEQWLQAKIVRQTDIYALGATMHLLATGHSPFPGLKWIDQRNAHLKIPYKQPVPRDPAEAYLFAVIEQCLRKSPDERFHSCEGLINLLKVIAEPLPECLCSSDDHARIGELQIYLSQGDICEAEADVLVNAANTNLSMNLGVASALRKAGGEEIEQEARQHAPASMGDVVWTKAGRLKAKWIAHAVAALNGAICLQRATLHTLFGADQRGSRTIAFPALGTGIGKVPIDLGAKLMLEAIRTFAWLRPKHIREVHIKLIDSTTLERWRIIMEAM